MILYTTQMEKFHRMKSVNVSLVVASWNYIYIYILLIVSDPSLRPSSKRKKRELLGSS